MENTFSMKCFKFLISTVLFLIFLGPLLFVIMVFIVYRTSVLIILKFKFGSQFGGLLTGSDAFFATDPSFRNVINIILIIRTKNNFQELFRKFKEAINMKIFENPDQFPKLLSTRHKMRGYHYFIQNQIKIDQCFRSLNLNYWENDDISKEELLKGISSYSSETLPCNNTAFWELLLCEKPIRWHNRIEQDEKSYAILFRFHHSLTDGVTIMKFFMNTFSDSCEKPETVPAQNNFRVKIRDIVDSIYVLLMTPIILLSQKLFRHVDVSSMDVPSLSGQQILVVKTEESRECVKIIKDIKQRMKHVSFVEVLITAISKSFSNYFQKKGNDPNLTTFGSYLTVLMRKSHLQLTEGKITKFRNMFSYSTLNIPIVYNNSNASFLYWTGFMETLEKVKLETRNFNASLDYKVAYGVFQVAPTLLPESVILRLVTPSYLPLTISNLPGPSATTLLGDCLIDDIVFWVPRIKPFGMTLGIFSYDDRLMITFNVDKAIMSNEDDAQDIVDGIYQALIQLDSKI